MFSSLLNISENEKKIFSTNDAGTTDIHKEKQKTKNKKSLDPYLKPYTLFGMDHRFYQTQNPKLISFWKIDLGDVQVGKGFLGHTGNHHKRKMDKYNTADVLQQIHVSGEIWIC